MSILVSFSSAFAASIAFQHFVGTLEQLLSIIKCNPIANASPSKPPAALGSSCGVQISTISLLLHGHERMIRLLCPAREFHSLKLLPNVDLPKALLWSRSSCAPVSRAALCRSPGSRCMRIHCDHGAAMWCADERNQTSKQESISTSS